MSCRLIECPRNACSGKDANFDKEAVPGLHHTALLCMHSFVYLLTEQPLLCDGCCIAAISCI